MNTPSRRSQRERVEESSRRLAEAAIELIAEKGFSNTTAQEIGIRAGYSRAMVRERFGSKEADANSVL
ncbi:TetR/AcrR family transcriptional regulator [Mycolicibacterium sp. P9-64]|nr:TetR/AcrR family transcriptional regulator [Mycolicibacterium sp. P9-64]